MHDSADTALHPTLARLFPAAGDGPPSYRLGRLIEARHSSSDAENHQLLDGLLAPQAHIDSKFFYDALGNSLFNAICELDEYYLTRAEDAIFLRCLASIVPTLPQRCQWIDLGCADGAKAHRWLRALEAQRYVGVDFSEPALRKAAQGIARHFPHIEIIGVLADLSRPLELSALLAERSELPPVLFYPGSSIGNFPPAFALELLRAFRHCCGNNGQLIVGVDRPKDRAQLLAAYNDRLGVTAAFNLNVLNVATRRLAADFDLQKFGHQAAFNETESRIEMYLVCQSAHRVRFGKPRPAERRFARGERIRTELSYKYEPAVFAALLQQAGFAPPATYSDPGEEFVVYVAEPEQPSASPARVPVRGERLEWIPAPRATSCSESLLRRFTETRRVSGSLLQGLSAEDCLLQSMPDASPVKWHLAHTTWFFEQFLLQQAVPGYHSVNPHFGALFNSYYVSVGERHPRPQRGFISRPELDEVLAYRRTVDDRVGELLADGQVPAHLLEVVELGIHHECQHQELMLTDLKHHFWCSPLRPAYCEGQARASSGPGPAPEWLTLPGGIAQTGHGGRSFAFDNELPRHRVWLEPFQLRSAPVTNSEYAAFIAAGGYTRPELWLSDGWDLRCREDWRGPLYWLNPDESLSALRCFCLTGERALAPREPVCHVSYYEADAYARWAGARLPTEFEWEAAATLDAHADGELNFLESRLLHPSPARTEGPVRLRQMFGDVWEWTQSAYQPYPGFAPPAGPLGEYNGKFMINQMVLRGGSCCSPAAHIRASYRNFFPPHARWQFSGIRLARTV